MACVIRLAAAENCLVSLDAATRHADRPPATAGT